MKIKDMFSAVDLLYNEWDLGKKASHSKGKTCAWIYLLEVLEESEIIIVERDKNKLIGFAGYAKWGSKKKIFLKKIYKLIKNMLLKSPLIKNKSAILKYSSNYDYLPEELKNYFDGELSMIIIQKEYRGKGIGKKMLLEIFDLARKDNIKKLQILTDESCNFKFYECCGCKKIYETTIQNWEPNKCKNVSELGYIYEKRLGKF